MPSVQPRGKKEEEAQPLHGEAESGLPHRRGGCCNVPQEKKKPYGGGKKSHRGQGQKSLTAAFCGKTKYLRRHKGRENTHRELNSQRTGKRISGKQKGNHAHGRERGGFFLNGKISVGRSRAFPANRGRRFPWERRCPRRRRDCTCSPAREFTPPAERGFLQLLSPPG